MSHKLSMLKPYAPLIFLYAFQIHLYTASYPPLLLVTQCFAKCIIRNKEAIYLMINDIFIDVFLRQVDSYNTHSLKILYT